MAIKKARSAPHVHGLTKCSVKRFCVNKDLTIVQISMAGKPLRIRLSGLL
jgi:hypothetical protein